MAVSNGHKYGNPFSRRNGTPPFLIIALLVLVTILSYYGWSLSSENKSLKNSVVLSYGKLREAAHNKVRLEKKNTVLSNRMVEMEEARDAFKSSREVESDARLKCNGLLNAEMSKSKDARRKNDELQNALTDAVKSVILPEEKASGNPISDTILKLSQLKGQFEKVKEEYIQLHNKHSDADKEAQNAKYEMEKCARNFKQLERMNENIKSQLISTRHLLRRINIKTTARMPPSETESPISSAERPTLPSDSETETNELPRVNPTEIKRKSAKKLPTNDPNTRKSNANTDDQPDQPDQPDETTKEPSKTLVQTKPPTERPSKEDDRTKRPTDETVISKKQVENNKGSDRQEKNVSEIVKSKKQISRNISSPVPEVIQTDQPEKKTDNETKKDADRVLSNKELPGKENEDKVKIDSYIPKTTTEIHSKPAGYIEFQSNSNLNKSNKKLKVSPPTIDDDNADAVNPDADETQNEPRDEGTHDEPDMDPEEDATQT